MENHLVRRIREGLEGGTFPRVRVVQYAQRIVGVGCHHHGIESLAEPGASADDDTMRIANHVDHAIA